MLIRGVCILVRAVSGSLWQEGVGSLEGADTEVILEVREQRLQHLLKNLHFSFLNKRGESCEPIL